MSMKRGDYAKSLGYGKTVARKLRRKLSQEPRVRKPGTGAGTSCPHRKGRQ